MMAQTNVLPGKVVGYDTDNDLAVIKIDAEGLNAVTLGTNQNMKVGDQV
jgi:S1-C subfamily serine protease